MNHLNEFLRRLLFLPPQASTVAREVDYLHYGIVLPTMLGALLVALAAGYFILRYRHRQLNPDGTPRDPHAPDAHASSHFVIPMKMEVGIIGAIFVMFVAWWVIGFKQFMKLRVSPAEAMDVYVTGKKWMWKFAYPQGRNSIAILYVPAGKPVRLVMTSRDVIHSFYVPDFRVKQDVVPGRTTTMWFEAKTPGKYEILCTEYCGTGHSTMRGEVVALSAHDWELWSKGEEPSLIATAPYREPAVLGELAPTPDLSMAAMGQRAASLHGCLRCHSVDGTPHLGPTWAGMYLSKVPLQGGGEVLADAGYLTESMMDPLTKIHAGFGPIMPTFQGVISPAETGAIVEYIKTLRHVRPGPALVIPVPQPGGAAPATQPAAPLPTGAALPPGTPGLDPGEVEAGKKAAETRGCLACHTTDGTPRVGPTWLGLYKSKVKLTGGTEVVADDAYLRESITNSMAKVHDGFPPSMPSFQGVIPDTEIDALVTYIKSLAPAAPAPAPTPAQRKSR